MSIHTYVYVHTSLDMAHAEIEPRTRLGPYSSSKTDRLHIYNYNMNKSTYREQIFMFTAQISLSIRTCAQR